MPSESHRFALVPFEARYAGTIQGWVVDREEAADWAGLDDVPRDPSMFARWHFDPEVHGSVLLRDGVPIGYGEVWENFEADAMELARPFQQFRSGGVKEWGRTRKLAFAPLLPHSHTRSLSRHHGLPQMGEAMQG